MIDPFYIFLGISIVARAGRLVKTLLSIFQNALTTIQIGYVMMWITIEKGMKRYGFFCTSHRHCACTRL